MPRTYHQKVCISGKGYHRLNDARILSTWKDKDDLDEQCYVMDWINNRGRYQSSGWQRSLEKDCLYINLYSPFHMVETTTKKKQSKNIHSKLLHTMTVIQLVQKFLATTNKLDTRQIKAKLFMTLSNNLYITGSKQLHEESIYNKVERP